MPRRPLRCSRFCVAQRCVILQYAIPTTGCEAAAMAALFTGHELVLLLLLRKAFVALDFKLQWDSWDSDWNLSCHIRRYPVLWCQCPICSASSFLALKACSDLRAWWRGDGIACLGLRIHAQGSAHPKRNWMVEVMDICHRIAHKNWGIVLVNMQSWLKHKPPASIENIDARLCVPGPNLCYHGAGQIRCEWRLLWLGEKNRLIEGWNGYTKKTYSNYNACAGMYVLIYSFLK